MKSVRCHKLCKVHGKHLDKAILCVKDIEQLGNGRVGVDHSNWGQLFFTFIYLSIFVPGGRRQLSGQSAGLVVKRSRVQVPAGTAGEFSSPVSTFCADTYFSTRSTPVLPQQRVKDLGNSAKSAGGRLQLNTYGPLRMWLNLHEVTWHGARLYGAHNALRRQQFHVAPAMQQHNSAVSTALRWIFKNAL